ncbi:MAG: ribosome biogenesis GTP-binding protein YihA/YsxC [Rhodothermales bacterium]
MTDAQFVTGATKWSALPSDGRPEVAFIGRSNVGKSSLLNLLAGRRALARTSGTPGKTQQFNYYLINNSLYFVDLPGFGYARVARTERERWGKFIGRYLAERETLRLVVHLVDSRHPPTALDLDVMSLMRGSNVPYVIALTKTDKLSGNERSKSLRDVEKVLEGFAMEVPIIQTSSKTRRGREDLLGWVDSVVATNT